MSYPGLFDEYKSSGLFSSNFRSSKLLHSLHGRSNADVPIEDPVVCLAKKILHICKTSNCAVIMDVTENNERRQQHIKFEKE